MKIKILSILGLIVLFGCSSYTYVSPSIIKNENKILQSNITTNYQKESQNFSQEKKIPKIIFNKAYPTFNFLKVSNFDRQRAINILKTIDYSYIIGLNEIYFIHSNKNVINNNEDGLYNQYTKSIEIYEDGESDEYLKRILLHELKHHYCVQKGYSFETIEESHQGCFLNTPIDREYGFIK